MMRKRMMMLLTMMRKRMMPGLTVPVSVLLLLSIIITMIMIID